MPPVNAIIAVSPVNDAPDAIDNSLAATEYIAATISTASLLANNSDVDLDSITFVSAQNAINGTVSVNAGNVIFTPAANYNGPASFTYTIRDAAGLTDTATVSLNIAAFNDAPIVSAGSVRISEEGLIGANVDAIGSTDTTNALTSSGTITISDVDNTSFAVTLSSPLTPLTSNGQTITWTGSETSTLVGSAGGKAIITATITNTCTYTVTLSGAVDHATVGVEDVISFGIGINVSDGSITTSNVLTVNIEDDSPIVIAAPNNRLLKVLLVPL